MLQPYFSKNIASSYEQLAKVYLHFSVGVLKTYYCVVDLLYKSWNW
jgi:hypothetical protein